MQNKTINRKPFYGFPHLQKKIQRSSLPHRIILLIVVFLIFFHTIELHAQIKKK